MLSLRGLVAGRPAVAEPRAGRVGSRTFAFVRAYLWQRVFGWLRRKHPKATWKELRRRFTCDGWWPAEGEVVLFNPAGVSTRRYYYRGTKIPSPWPIGA